MRSTRLRDRLPSPLAAATGNATSQQVLAFQMPRRSSALPNCPIEIVFECPTPVGGRRRVPRPRPDNLPTVNLVAVSFLAARDDWSAQRLVERRRSYSSLPLGTELKLNRFGATLAVMATALVLSGCGSDNNASGGNATTGASSANVSCGGKKTLKASGSTAQANAMTRFVKAFEQACSGQTLNYTANGSGAGITEFVGNQTDFGGSDSPLASNEYGAAQQRCGSPAWNLPVVGFDCRCKAQFPGPPVPCRARLGWPILSGPSMSACPLPASPALQ